MSRGRNLAPIEFDSFPQRSGEFFERLSQNILAKPPDIKEYFKQAWPILEPARPLVFSWHIDCILDYLLAVDLGQIRDLVISVQPRLTKSITVSVIWPTHSWTASPWLRWIFSSFSGSLSTKHNLDRRTILASAWYQRQWGDMVKFTPDQNQKTEFQNTARGHMVAMGIGGTVTGKGGDRLVVDDLINPEMAESEADRETAIRFWDYTLSTRLDDPNSGARVVVAQRTHRKDHTAHVLKEKGFTHLCLPAEAPKKTTIVFPVSGRKIVREEGSILCPERTNAVELAKAKLRGSRFYNAQYLQNPSSDDSDFFNRAWWQYYKIEAKPEERRSAWGWDTAVKEKQTADFSAGMRVAECIDNNFYLSPHRFMERVAYPTLKQSFLNEVLSQPADAAVIEDKSSGQQLLQDMRMNSTIAVIPMESDKDKVFRASLVSPTVQARKVFLPEGVPWVAEFVEKMQNFPDVEHDDDVDAFVNAMLFLLGKLKTGLPGVWST